MKRKNILKFVSLLGIGSFVMLAAASCTSAPAPTPTPTPNPEPNPMPNPGGGVGMSDGNTNPGNGGGMMGDNPNSGNTTPEQQLAAARKTLTDLLGTENTNVALYADYAKIQSTLSTAYMTAKTASENTSATLDNLRSASTTLQSKTNSLEGLSENKYSGIKNHVSKLFDTGSAITARTLDPTSGERPTLEKVNEANNGIKMAISSESLNKWKTNADKFNDFEKNPLSKEKLESTNDTAHNQEQPANWSFAAYSVDLTSNSQNLPNWNFAQRKVWTSEGQEGGRTVLVSSPVSSTDVSWIYSLAGEGTKYTLSFEYYGPDTAFLYFPYKLVKQADSNSVALQYSLNKASPKLINFQPVRTEPANADSTTNETTTTGSSESRSSSEVLVADEAATSNNEMNPTPTVDSINIAKVTLTGLAFGQNTIEFSVPTDQTNKVAPMIGNMFISSNSESQEKIYNQIFGNTSNLSTDSRSVTIDLLKGYSLASGWSTYVGEFKRLTGANQTASDSQTSAPSYLVGYIAGSWQRTVNNVNNVSNIIRNPQIAGQRRTLAIYVNAPSDGQYGISGSYISTNRTQRSLKFQTGSDDSNSVTINVTAKTAWTALETFDTSDTTNNVVSGNMAKRTLHLKQGLNKIVISGTNDTPYIGNLTFTLNNNPLSNTESETREST
ncbi:FIVAR domain-containing protein [Mycoplasmoides gallisepticum]|nr:FIVAR domain-containing protein [Mycoplasmoides gallisepticum]